MKKSPFLFLVLFLVLASGCTPVEKVIPTQTPVPATSTATLTSTATQTETATITTTPVPSGPCDNPLVPLVPGSSYEYQVTTSTGLALFTLNIGEREDIGNINIKVHLIDHKHAWDIKELVICDEGEIPNFPLYIMSMLLVDQFKTILNTYHYHETAPYVPAYPILAENDWIYTWEPGYVLEEGAYLVNPMGGADLALLAMSPVDLVFSTQGTFVSIDEPAGVYPNALQVEVEYHMHATIMEGSAGSGASLVIRSTQWYVPFLGLVRAQVDAAELDYYGQVFAADISSQLDLI